jgi:hypothetical protein
LYRIPCDHRAGQRRHPLEDQILHAFHKRQADRLGDGQNPGFAAGCRFNTPTAAQGSSWASP